MAHRVPCVWRGRLYCDSAFGKRVTNWLLSASQCEGKNRMVGQKLCNIAAYLQIEMAHENIREEKR